MSLIFDALQRSEAENSGVDRSVLSAATEVLQRAELRARSERKALDQFKQPGPEQRVDRDISFPPPRMPQAAIAVDAAEPMEMPANDRHLEDFEGFQSLKVVVPPQNRLVCLTDS